MCRFCDFQPQFGPLNQVQLQGSVYSLEASKDTYLRWMFTYVAECRSWNSFQRKFRFLYAEHKQWNSTCVHHRLRKVWKKTSNDIFCIPNHSLRNPHPGLLGLWKSGIPGDFQVFQAIFAFLHKSQLMKKSTAGENFDEKFRRQKILSKRVP